MNWKTISALLGTCLLFASLCSKSFAGSPLPQATGPDGFINVGVAASSAETNLYAETTFSDLGAARIENINDSPGSENFGLPVFLFEFAYTWADSKTRLFIGSQLEDAVRFDFSIGVGLRQGTEGLGVFGLDSISMPGGLKVWSDPYETGIDRDTTKSGSNGLRASWDKILGSNLEIRISSRKLKIDDETSGAALGLTSAERRLLRREGDVNRFDAAYEFNLSRRKQLIPRLSLIERELDGKALSRMGRQFDLSYINKGRLTYIANILIGTSEYDEINPAYGRKDKADRTGLSLTVIGSDAFGLKDWSWNAGLAWAEEDHDIDFYDVQVSTVFIGMLRRF